VGMQRFGEVERTSHKEAPHAKETDGIYVLQGELTQHSSRENERMPGIYKEARGGEKEYGGTTASGAGEASENMREW